MDRSELVKALEELDHIQEVLDCFPGNHFGGKPYIDNPIENLRYRISRLLERKDRESIRQYGKALRWIGEIHDAT